MTELFVCWGMWAGMCGKHVVQQFPTEQACQAVLADMRTLSGFTYGFCRVPEKK